MSIPNIHTTIDYKKLIKDQANQVTGRCYVEQQKNTKQKTYTKQMMKRNNRKIGG